MAKTKAKALTRKITRKRAMSYDRMAPNKRGVTALSEVNGRGAYAKRYARTRRKLEEDSMPKRRRKRRKSSASAKRASFKPNLEQGGRKKKRVSKKEFVAAQQRKGRSRAQAESAYKLATGYYEKAKARNKRGRRYGKGKYKALKARVGSGDKRRERYTYFYRSPKGNVRKIPDHALLGYRSARDMLEVQRTGTEAERGRLSKRMQALLDRRIRAGKRAEQRAIEGRAWFSPNPGEVLTFEEWNTMKRNARSTKKSSRKKKTSRPTTKAAYIRSQMAKGRSRAQAEGDWNRSQKMKRKARSGGKRKTTARKSRKTTSRKRSTRRKKTTGRKRKTSSRKKSTRRKASTRKRKATTRKRSTRRKSSSRVKRDSAGRRITAKRRAAAKRNLKKACRTVRKMKSNKRGSYALARRSPSKTKRSSKKRRSMKPNAVGAAYQMELRNSFKFGFIVLGGFVTHRIVTNLFDRYALSKVEALGKGAIAPWRKSLSGLLVAAVGVPLTIRVLPKHAGVAAAGMGASLLYDLLMTGLTAAKMDSAAEAISAYPNAPGYPQYSGMGSYYEFSPHQVYGSGYGGFGEYYETQYTPGLEQAAAGMGGEPLMQAAAGVQQMAANQMGEYYAYGAEGIGEYEAAPSAPSSAGYIDDGIQPNMHSAEQSLDVAEAMAGGVGNYDVLTQAAAGFGDLPLEQTVTPTIRAMDVPDSPGGSRAGILAGGDGIFG